MRSGPVSAIGRPDPPEQDACPDMTDDMGAELPREAAGEGPADPIEKTPFYIPATESAARPRHTLKHGDTFAVIDSFGDIGASAGGPDGLFDHDTR